MEPKAVVVRTFMENPKKLWIVAVGKKLVYLTDEHGLNSMLNGQQPQFEVGFPFGDVFVGELQDDSKPDWSALRPFLAEPPRAVT